MWIPEQTRAPSSTFAFTWATRKAWDWTLKKSMIVGIFKIGLKGVVVYVTDG